MKPIVDLPLPGKLREGHSGSQVYPRTRAGAAGRAKAPDPSAAAPLLGRWPPALRCLGLSWSRQHRPFAGDSVRPGGGAGTGAGTIREKGPYRVAESRYEREMLSGEAGRDLQARDRHRIRYCGERPQLAGRADAQLAFGGVSAAR
jgi:hypothetical protein